MGHLCSVVLTSCCVLACANMGWHGLKRLYPITMQQSNQPYWQQLWYLQPVTGHFTLYRQSIYGSYWGPRDIASQGHSSTCSYGGGQSSKSSYEQQSYCGYGRQPAPSSTDQELKGYQIMRVTLRMEGKLFQDLRRQANMACPCDPVCGHSRVHLTSLAPSEAPTVLSSAASRLITASCDICFRGLTLVAFIPSREVHVPTLD